MSKYKQICNNCNTDYKSNGPYSKYCSKECRQESRAQERTYVGCTQCNTPIRFYPSQQNKFCSNSCQGKWVKENMKEERIELAAHMRKSWSEESWKKSLETRKKNGNIIENFDWKQYWKRCDWLTRKIRKQMLETWDGYDYIDGEYIKDNLKLHYSDKNYPTLDHIKSRSQCFKEGLSPYEATTIENLKWTKRVNNSKKYNK
jgi:hypothetical protein